MAAIYRVLGLRSRVEGEPWSPQPATGKMACELNSFSGPVEKLGPERPERQRLSREGAVGDVAPHQGWNCLKSRDNLRKPRRGWETLQTRVLWWACSSISPAGPKDRAADQGTLQRALRYLQQVTSQKEFWFLSCVQTCTLARGRSHQRPTTERERECRHTHWDGEHSWEVSAPHYTHQFWLHTPPLISSPTLLVYTILTQSFSYIHRSFYLDAFSLFSVIFSNHHLVFKGYCDILWTFTHFPKLSSQLGYILHAPIITISNVYRKWTMKGVSSKVHTFNSSNYYKNIWGSICLSISDYNTMQYRRI